MRELAPPKAGSRRVVPIPDSLVQMLLERKMAAPNKNGPVFASRVGGRLSHRNVQRRGFDPAADDAGIDATFHDLRHYFGSRLASQRPHRPPDRGRDGPPADLDHRAVRLTLQRLAVRRARQGGDELVMETLWKQHLVSPSCWSCQDS
jgi:integrase